MGKCPKCGVQLGKDETIQWQCSSCNCKLSWNLDKFIKTICAKQHQIDINKQSAADNIIKSNGHRKYSVIILSILLAISFLVNGTLFYQFNDTQEKLSQNIINNTNEEIISLNSKLTVSRSDLLKLQSDYDKLNQSYKKLNQNYQSSSDLLLAYKDKLSNKQNRIEELKDKINYKNSRIRILKSDKKSLQSKLNTRRSSSSSSSSTSSAYTVYVTDYGEKYHRAGCRYLWNSSSAMSVSSARAAGYTPCSICNP